MVRLLVVFLLAGPALAGEPLYRVDGRVAFGARALISLFGAVHPFQATTKSDSAGRFLFPKLREGTYTVVVYIAGRGEARQTVEVGPGTADAHHRVVLSLQFQDGDFVFRDAVRRRTVVTTKQLAVPAKATVLYEEGRKDLGRHDVESAIKRLEAAVKLAPGFVEAWNDLGVIAYQTHHYERAEECFRAALQYEPTIFEGLVNLGGVLLVTSKLPEALEYNEKAVLLRPNDALANSQLGQVYFALGDLAPAVRYLEKARHLDPGHFSHPQLVLAEIHLRRGDNLAAAAALEDFVRRHPDYPTAARIRDTIARLRQ